MANWDRQYRLRVGVEGSKGFEVGKPDDKTKQAIHINFMVERSDSTTLNTTKIKLWNLNKEQINILTQTGCQLNLSAGYGESRPIVFKGTVSNVQESLDGSDRLIEIEAVDGFAQLSETVVSISYGGKIATDKILRDAAAKLNLPVTYSATAQEILERSYFSKVSRTIGTDKYAAVLENVKEEVADVQIMLDQVRTIFRFHTEAIEEAKLRRLEERLNGRNPCPLCAEDEHSPFCFDAYVPVSADGDIIEKSDKPGEEWVFHARFCPECGRRL